MKPYRKNYTPKSRAEVAGANDHLWLHEAQKWPADKARFDESFERAFGKKKYWFEK